MSFLAAPDEEADVYAHLAFDEDEEELVEMEVFFGLEQDQTGSGGDSYWDVKPGEKESLKRAFDSRNPFRPKWVSATDKERLRLECYKCWRKLSPSEEADWKRGLIKATPCALLLNKKRNSTYKARLVVLGDRWDNPQQASCYASVVSQVGNRTALTVAARDNFYPLAFDIGNAFIRASIGNLHVVVTLPQMFRDSAMDSGRRVLEKALYGLPVSPRLWAKRLAQDLRGLHFQECKHEPGVWVLRSKSDNRLQAVLTVYVDDCLVAAETPELAEKIVTDIHNIHPCSRIPMEPQSDGSVKFDLLGADVFYNQLAGSYRVTMEDYCNKVLKRFDVPDTAKARANPNFPEDSLYHKSNLDKHFKYRECIGALQWLATVCRPDLAHSTNVLARAAANPCTNSMSRCARLVLKYLKGTTRVGISYSKEQEAEFNAKYTELQNHAENLDKVDPKQVDNAVHTFTDASFGVVYKSLRSISGVVVYLYGTPIAWRSKVQSVFASSTTESEWIALAEGVELEASVHALLDFLIGKPQEPGPLWCDNRGAVVCGRRGPECTDEIPKRTRHVALRLSKVLQEHKRLWFCPTNDQLADGLTKSANSTALRNILHCNSDFPAEAEMDGDEGEAAYYSFYVAMCRRS
jgi:hypothetical protein